MQARNNLSKQIRDCCKKAKKVVFNNIEGTSASNFKINDTKAMQNELNKYFDVKPLKDLQLISTYLLEENKNLRNYYNSDIAFSELTRVAKLLIVNKYLTDKVNQKINFIQIERGKINLL